MAASPVQDAEHKTQGEIKGSPECIDTNNIYMLWHKCPEDTSLDCRNIIRKREAHMHIWLTFFSTLLSL
jgi:hypothetical protein